MVTVPLFVLSEDCYDRMDININQLDDITIVELEGSFDSNAAYETQDQILSAVGTNNKMLLDMSKVTYMSSAGLRILLLIYRRISSNIGHVVITGLSEELRDIMSITGFLDFFTTYDNRDAGVKSLRSS